MRGIDSRSEGLSGAYGRYAAVLVLHDDALRTARCRSGAVCRHALVPSAASYSHDRAGTHRTMSTGQRCPSVQGRIAMRSARPKQAAARVHPVVAPLADPAEILLQPAHRTCTDSSFASRCAHSFRQLHLRAMDMTRDDILSRIVEILQHNFDIDAERVTVDARLSDDLDIDSIDAVDLIVQLRPLTEQRLTPDAFKLVRTIGDVVDALYALAHADPVAAG